MTPLAIEQLTVVIPANDEEVLVGLCLVALRRAVLRVAAERDGIRVSTLVVLDACTDRTAEIVRRMPGVDAVEVDYRSVGASRAHGVMEAIARAGVSDPSRLWIANTDADSQVPEDWLLDQLRLAEAGAQAVIGAIEPDPLDLSPSSYRAWAERRDADDSTSHVHGANLGVRADSYLGAGGFPPALEHEDVILVERLLAIGARTVRTRTATVTTSARTVGRTPGGYAAFVRDNY